MSEVMPEGSSFGDSKTVRLLDDRINALMRICYRGRRRMTLSQSLDSMQSALPSNLEELKSLREKLKEASEQHVRKMSSLEENTLIFSYHRYKRPSKLR